MLNKLRLDQTRIYEKHLALEEISTMLVSFVKGCPHHLAIGAEQGNIDKWDDFVIEKSNGSHIYIQAKRQTTPFSSDEIVRNTYTTGSRTDHLRDLSPLDESLESLANWINSADFNTRDEFWLELLDNSTEIKARLEIRHLRYLLENQYRSITTARDLENLASRDSNVQNIFNWLTHWCGFSGWDHIITLMKVLKIRTSGTELDINLRVKNNLSHIFQSTEVEALRSLKNNY